MKRSCEDTAIVSAAAPSSAAAGGDDKRPRTTPDTGVGGALVVGDSKNTALATTGPERTSDLLAPIMCLTGHDGPVLSCKFSPDGQHILSGSHDKMILLWDTFGECANVMNFKGHSNAVLEVNWAADGEYLFSGSADRTGAMWDARTGARVRMYRGHTGVVNSFCPAREHHICASASDDKTCRVWDSRVKHSQEVLRHPWQVTAAAVAHDGMRVFTGCLDGVVRSYDLRRPGEVELELEGHQDIVTGLSLSRDGDHLLSNAMDNVVRCWDVKPYCAEEERCPKVFLGAQHNFEKGLLRCSWSPTGTHVGAGSADSFVYIWDAATKRIAYKLPGHTGCVNEVDFHPLQPIIASCGNDKQIYVGEIKAPPS